MRTAHAIGALAIAAGGISHCLDPTEIVVVVSTDVPCGSVNSTAIAVGPPGDDSRGVSAQTTSCASDGGIGTLVVTPSHGRDEQVEIRVTLGIGGTAADQCAAPNFSGCIVARRQLYYEAHRPLTLPVELQQVCLNNPCDPNSTCVSGACVDAGVPSCDQTGTCTLDAGPTPNCDVPAKYVRPVSAPVTPYLVRTSSGYAIGYETLPVTNAQRQYHVFAVSLDGSPQPDVTLNSKPIAANTPIGPLATDGTNYFASYIYDTTGLMQLEQIDPQGTNLHTDGTTTYTPAVWGGGHFDTSGPALVFFTLLGGTPTFVAWSPPPNTIVTAPIQTSAQSDAALAFFNGVYYASYHNASACWLYSATFTEPNNIFQFQPVGGWSCTTVRYAENAPSVSLYATRELLLSAEGGAPTYPLMVRPSVSATPGVLSNTVDDQAIVALPAGGTAFHVVWSNAGTIKVSTVNPQLPTANTSSTIASGTGFQTAAGAGIGFDAVADPGTSGYAVAFWSATPNPGIYFTRACK